jgi:hypothetical protein
MKSPRPAGVPADETGQFQNVQILADTHFDRLFVLIILQKKCHRVGEIVDVEELAARRSGAQISFTKSP